VMLVVLSFLSRRLQGRDMVLSGDPFIQFATGCLVYFIYLPQFFFALMYRATGDLTIKMHGRVLGHFCIQYCVLFLVAFITMSSATTLARLVYDRSAKYDVPMHYHYDQLLVLLESVLYTHLV